MVMRQATIRRFRSVADSSGDASERRGGGEGEAVRGSPAPLQMSASQSQLQQLRQASPLAQQGRALLQRLGTGLPLSKAATPEALLLPSMPEVPDSPRELPASHSAARSPAAASTRSASSESVDTAGGGAMARMAEEEHQRHLPRGHNFDLPPAPSLTADQEAADQVRSLCGA